MFKSGKFRIKDEHNFSREDIKYFVKEAVCNNYPELMEDCKIYLSKAVQVGKVKVYYVEWKVKYESK